MNGILFLDFSPCHLFIARYRMNRLITRLCLYFIIYSVFKCKPYIERKTSILASRITKQLIETVKSSFQWIPSAIKLSLYFPFNRNSIVTLYSSFERWFFERFFLAIVAVYFNHQFPTSLNARRPFSRGVHSVSNQFELRFIWTVTFGRSLAVPFNRRWKSVFQFSAMYFAGVRFKFTNPRLLFRFKYIHCL